jgi:hypothetical protein
VASTCGDVTTPHMNTGEWENDRETTHREKDRKKEMKREREGKEI